MSDIDTEVLNAISSLIAHQDAEGVQTVRRLWSDRNTLLEALDSIRMWDMTHAEAMTLGRAIAIAEVAIQKVGGEL